MSTSTSFITRCRQILPGLLLALAVTGIAQAIASWPALNAIVPLSALTVGIILGIVMRLCLPLPAWLDPGIGWTLFWLLRAGIVLLGFQVGLQNLASVGLAGLLLVIIGVVSTLFLAVALGRWLGLPDSLSALMGCGTGICGASAIVAANGVIRGREQDVACSVATITVLGTIAIFAYPALAHVMGLSNAVYGAWAGTSVHEVAQAVAAGFAYNQDAGVQTSLYKLARVAMLAPVCAGLAFWWQRRRSSQAGEVHGKAVFPKFVLLFVLVVLFNSAVELSDHIHNILVSLDTALLATAMSALGLKTRLSSILHLGWRPVLLGIVLTLWLAILSLAGGLLVAA